MADLSADNKAAAQAPHRKVRIGDLLVSNGVITEAQLMSALAEQKKTGQKLGYTLVDMGVIDEMRLLEFLSQQLQIKLVDVLNLRVDSQVVRLLPETVARRYRMAVLENHEHEVLLGMADPTDLFAYDEASRLLKKRVRQAVVREADLLRMLGRWYQDQEDLSELAGELHQELAEGDVDLQQMLTASGAEDAPVVRLLQKLFDDAVQHNASDIHIEPEERLLRIRQRVDGVLHERVMNEVRIAPALEAVLAQRLVRRLCRHCAVTHVPDEHEAAWLARQQQDDSLELRFKQGSGCDRCNHTGYRGRVGVYELLEMRGDLLLALRNQDIDGFAVAAKADPRFKPIATAALEMASAGQTSLAEVMRVSGD